MFTLIKHIKHIIMLSATVLLVDTAFAQQLRPNSTVNASRSSFKIDAVKFGSMGVSNSRNAYYGRVPKEHYRDFYITYNDPSGAINAFKEVFNNSRVQQLLTEPNIGINYYVSRAGKVMEVSFILNSATKVTAAELENLEDALKRKMTFTVRDDSSKNRDFYIISQNILFKKVLNSAQ